MQDKLTFFVANKSENGWLRQNVKEICSKNHVRYEFITTDEFMDHPKMYELSDPIVVLSNDVNFVKYLSNYKPKQRIVVTEKPKDDISNVSSVSYSITDYALQLCNHLAEMGRKHAALFSFCHSSIYVEEHIAAYMRAAKQYGIEIGVNDIYWRDRCSLADCWKQIRVKMPIYDTIICCNDMSAVYVSKAATEEGYLVPRDCSVSGRGDTLMGRLTRPTITTGIQDSPGFARQLFKFCRYLQKEDAVYKMDVMMKQSLRVGESTNINADMFNKTILELTGRKVTDTLELRSKVLANVEQFLFDSDSLSLAIIYELMEGRTNQEIVERLYIEERTLAYRMKKMKEILGVSSKQELVEVLRAFDFKQ